MNIQTDKNKQPFDFKLYIIAGLFAFLAGFAAVFFAFDRGGEEHHISQQVQNASGLQSVKSYDKPKNKAEIAQASTQNEKKSGLRAFSKGEMTAFVVRPEPKDIKAFEFNDANGNRKTLKDWEGKVVLLNLWATWCGPCREEMPAFDQLKKQLGGEDFDLVAISIDRGGIERPKKFLEEIKIKHLALFHDPKARLNITLSAFGMPTTLLINREGKEIGRLVGPAKWDSKDAVDLIQAAIKQNPQENK
ncbi:MAG: TlpA disulfide reductase family protein [Pseudomonadota bacterium]